MSICGAVAMTVTYTISDLAENCGETATGLGIVFLWEAIGGVVGGISSVYLYHHFAGNWILITIGWLIGGVLVSMPFITHAALMELAYFWVGVFSITIQIGCLHLVRRIQQESAGHWLALTQAANSAGSTLAYIFDWKLGLSMYLQFIVLAMVVCCVSSVFLIVPFSADDVKQIESSKSVGYAIQQEEDSQDRRNAYYNTTALEPSGNVERESHEDDGGVDDNTVQGSPPHYYVEIIVGIAASLSNGAVLSFSAYFTTYVSDVDIESTEYAKYQYTLFWLMLSIGRIVGTIDQYTYVTDNNLVGHIVTWMSLVATIAVIWYIFWDSSTALWIIAPCLGFCGGPILGYIYDWVHRLTLPSELSTTIIFLNAFAGGHALMYVCAYIWDAGGGPRTLMGVMFATSILSIPFVWWGKEVSYLEKFHNKNIYSPLPTSERL